jgi:hypothetical protein
VVVRGICGCAGSAAAQGCSAGLRRVWGCAGIWGEFCFLELNPWRSGQIYYGIFICGQIPVSTAQFRPVKSGQILPSELKFYYQTIPMSLERHVYKLHLQLTSHNVYGRSWRSSFTIIDITFFIYTSNHRIRNLLS